MIESKADLEYRLELLENQAQQRKKRKRYNLMLLLMIIAVVALLVGIGVVVRQHNSFGHQLSQLHAGFTLYAPQSSSPQPYQIDRNGLQNNSGFVTYTLRNGDKTITVTQQATPNKAPDLSVLSGFDKVSVEGVGDGVIGETAGRTIAVIVTDNTLINISGSEGVTKQTIKSLATSLKTATK